MLLTRKLLDAGVCVCVCVCVCVSSPLDTDLFSFVEEGKKSIINDGVGALLRH